MPAEKSVFTGFKQVFGCFTALHKKQRIEETKTCRLIGRQIRSKYLVYSIFYENLVFCWFLDVNPKTVDKKMLNLKKN